MIGGNIQADLQVRTTFTNSIGEQVETWETALTLTGFLDLESGDSKYTTANAKMQESTHIFICDYKPLNELIEAENSRLVVKGKTYDIMLIDNPMELDLQLEIYLKYTGGEANDGEV